MFLFVNVTGLKKVIFNQTEVYKLVVKKNERVWIRKDPLNVRKDHTISHEKMVNALWNIGLDNEKFDAWIHGDTYNIKTLKNKRVDRADKKKLKVEKAKIKESKKQLIKLADQKKAEMEKKEPIKPAIKKKAAVTKKQSVKKPDDKKVVVDKKPAKKPGRKPKAKSVIKS